MKKHRNTVTCTCLLFACKEREEGAARVPYSSTATNIAQEEYGDINISRSDVDHARYSHFSGQQEFKTLL